MKTLENNKGIPQVDLANAVSLGDRQAAAAILRQLAIVGSYSPEFREYLADLATALETDLWEKMGEHFLENRWIDNREKILLLAPYLRRIDGQDVTKLTLLLGELSPSAPVTMENAAIEVFGTLNQPIPKLLVINLSIAVGSIGGEEAFIAPGGWRFPNSHRGSAILAANVHLQRCDEQKQRIHRIFEPQTAALLLSALSDPEAIIQEYYQHEAGHALGLGLDLKNRLRMFNTPKQSGGEEWKTDIGGWRLAAEVFPPAQVGKLISCTLLIRWGIDFCRPGAPTNDHDAISSLFILDRLLQSGEMYLTNDRLLALRDVSFDGLFQATQIHRSEAEKLVREELDRRDDPSSIMPHLEAITASPETIALHQEFIARCQDLAA
jgi:hypothetical protein